MEPLLTTFLAAALAEFGDKTQLLVAALAARYGKPGPILAGVALAALANALLAAWGGTIVHDAVTLRALSLLVALSLLLAGAAGLARSKPPELSGRWRTGAFVTAAAAFFLHEFGDKTQFITAALAAQFDSLPLAAAGGAAGVVAAALPAVLLGAGFQRALPVRAVRTGAALLFLLAGLVVALRALRLV